MSQIEYRNRSISQLVSELNNLGQATVMLQPVRLLGVHEQDMDQVKRFKNSHGQQFFMVQGNEKKYIYNQIVQNLSAQQLRLLAQLYCKGFNVTLLFSRVKDQEKTTQLIDEIVKWMGDAAYCSLQFGEQDIREIVGDGKIAERDIQNRLKFYKVKEENGLVFLDKVIREGKESINVIKIRKIEENLASINEVNLIVLPQQFFASNLRSGDYLGVVKSQLTQILNYIKLNPNKKYQHFSKLLTKRLPVTNIIASLILEQSCSLVLNWINEGSTSNLSERFSFYEKIRGLSALLKRQNGYRPPLIDLPKQYVLNKKEKMSKSREVKPFKTDRTPISRINQENEIDYCRSLQRKTHKYSINELNQQGDLFSSNLPEFEGHSEFRVTYNTPSPVTHQVKSEKRTDKNLQQMQFNETLPKRGTEKLKETEEIAILKANHAIEISQYHQTIQQLNRKILALTNEKGLEELYTLHERELMLLQLKIKQLRDDLSALCKGGDEKSYKSMVRKLNDQIKRLQNKNAEQKVSSGRVMLLEKQVNEVRGKYEESEVARKKLAFELEHLTKRLKICDFQIESLNKKQVKQKEALGCHSTDYKNSNGEGKLSINDVEYLKEVEVLLSGVRSGDQNAKQFLMRKISNVLEDLSGSRNTILECNDFLIQLEQHLEERLGEKQPQIVLDCNKFIRNFLMDNLNIF